MKISINYNMMDWALPLRVGLGGRVVVVQFGPVFMVFWRDNESYS